MSRYDGIKNRLSQIDKSLVPTPEEIAQKMIDLIPNEFWESKDIHKKKFLNIYSKSGVFEVAIKNKLLSLKSFTDKYNSLEECEESIYNMIYSITPNEFCAELIRGELYNDCDMTGNVKVLTPKGYENLVKLTYPKKGNLRNEINNQLKLIKERIIKEFSEEDKEMEFDVVVGNPPYNNDIYIDFVQLGHTLSKDYTIMITPAKWQAKGGGATIASVIQ